VVELNDEGLYGNGQLASLLRSRYCQTKIRGINKTDGLTFKVQEILNHLKAKLQTSAVA
jgi:2-oxoglutarate ferredoxin oxidoreductase subunit alpha